MTLRHRSVLSDRIRIPAVQRGEVVIVGRYSHEHPKAAIVNPEDLAMLEDANDILDAIQESSRIAIDELAERIHFDEDRPDGRAVTDPAKIREILGL